RALHDAGRDRQHGAVPLLRPRLQHHRRAIRRRWRPHRDRRRGDERAAAALNSALARHPSPAEAPQRFCGTVRTRVGIAGTVSGALMLSTMERYQRIAPIYDLLDLPFERRRYRALRPLLFQNLGGRLLDAGIGTGRNCAFYPPDALVSGIDISPAMLARAHRRCPTLSAAGRLYRMDVTELEFPTGSFDAAVATFLFCVLPNELQVQA